MASRAVTIKREIMFWKQTPYGAALRSILPGRVSLELLRSAFAYDRLVFEARRRARGQLPPPPVVGQTVEMNRHAAYMLRWRWREHESP